MHHSVLPIVIGLLLATMPEIRATPAMDPSPGATVTQPCPNPLSQATGKLKAAGPTQLYDHGDPTAEEQLMLELINRARSNPSAEAARLNIDLNEGLSPGTLNANPKPPLALNRFLLAAARSHSQWMLDNQQFSHAGADASDPGNRMSDAGYSFTGAWRYGENIAFQGTTTIPVIAELVAASHDDLFIDEGIEGRGHRINLMQSSFREIGIGVRTGQWEQSGRLYNIAMSTQDFASSDGSHRALLLGVIFRDTNRDGFYSVGEGIGGVTIMPDRGNDYAVSSASGGYAIPLDNLNGQVTLTYSSTQWPASITRTVSLTGVNVKIDIELNADLVNPPTQPRFTRITRQANSAFVLAIEGGPGQTVTIQASSDLGSWQDLGVVTLKPSTGTFTDSQASTQPRRYYRAVVKP
ncbi:MAG TPA: CAP domain-containing protein [Candidatus Paceibacterota bacterium]|nr:CAP domain-containing protein [Verrucomicrobiota bacterium]HRY50917.1 CAP domain-containing protein [Candidatus Paceibacterota bacterium]